MQKVLLISVGLSPQIVTETMQALIERDGDERFVPNRLIMVTTTKGRDRIEQTLTRPGGKLEEFRREFRLPKIDVQIEVPRDRDGSPIEHTRDERATIAFADAFTRLLALSTTDPLTAVHVSLAGGQKNMAAYVALATQNLGRLQDRLSYIVVQPRFERHPDFWWKPKTDTWIGQDGDPERPRLWTGDAGIDLMMMPFLPMNHVVPRAVAESLSALTYERLVSDLHQARASRSVVLWDAARTVAFGQTLLRLPSKPYAMYRVIAEAARTAQPGAGPNGFGSNHSGWLTSADFADAGSPSIDLFIEIYRISLTEFGADGHPVVDEEGKPRLVGDDSVRTLNSLNTALRICREYERSPKAEKRNEYLTQKDYLRDFFEQARGDLNRELKDGMANTLLRDRFRCHSVGKKPARFGLLLAPDEIIIPPPDALPPRAEAKPLSPASQQARAEKRSRSRSAG